MTLLFFRTVLPFYGITKYKVIKEEFNMNATLRFTAEVLVILVCVQVVRVNAAVMKKKGTQIINNANK